MVLVSYGFDSNWYSSEDGWPDQAVTSIWLDNMIEMGPEHMFAYYVFTSFKLFFITSILLLLAIWFI